ncbi:MAG TPA: hypothetical protein VEF33_01590 [Syntrophales bacterium]|nr:hypothetical protein [Syntrophales bacterium]
MKRKGEIFYFLILFIFAASCTAYKAQPLPFKLPDSYPNVKEVAGAKVGAKAYADSSEAKEAFGFNIRDAGMLPVQVVFDNQGSHSLEIIPSQTFLEDKEGNIWPVLASNIAYDRATKYVQTKEIFKEGMYSGFLGATAGALVGAAIGIVSGRNVGEAIGKGAAIGAAGGGLIGGAKGAMDAENARRAVIEDLQHKTMQNKAIEPMGLSYGIIFFPGEAQSAKQLRLQVVEKDTGIVHLLQMSPL